MPIFLREHSNGMYRTDVYFLSKSLVELGVYILFPFIAFAIPYYVIGLNPAVERFFIAAGIIILVSNVATSFGVLLTSYFEIYLKRNNSVFPMKAILSPVLLRHLK